MKINLQLFGGGGSSSGFIRRFKEVTHPSAKIRGHREYIQKDTNLKIRKDPARKNDPEHWHVENPNKTGDSDMYLDKYGNPSPRHDPSSALSYEEFINLLKKLGGK